MSAGSNQKHPSSPTPFGTRCFGKQSPIVLNIDLPIQHPFDAQGIFSFLEARAIAGVETTDLSQKDRLIYARTLMFPSGPGAIRLIARNYGSASWVLKAQLELQNLRDQAAAIFRIRRLLNLDADSSAIDLNLSRDPALEASILRTPGIRVPGAVDPHELVIRAIIGQQISVKAARTHLSRLVAQAGAAYTSSFTGLDRIFPAPADIIETVHDPGADLPLDPDRVLKLPRRSISTLRSAAIALQSGELEVGFESNPQLLRESLLRTPGIGPWTAAYLAMRVLGDPDAWMRSDVALVSGAVRLGILEPQTSKSASHRLLEEYARRWSPWRSYASMHLWQAASG
ncbi:DNA-3-methyladenine glycosylase II [Arthrobacter sp. AG1021]|nr:DNA-3-methyladenine glycosylase II [Arthrobacter sp. AG1021]